MVNPWKVKCPHCGILLETTLLVKIFGVLAPFLGLAVAGVAIYFEEIGRWQTINSVIFLAATFSIIGIVCFACYPYMKFTKK